MIKLAKMMHGKDKVVSKKYPRMDENGNKLDRALNIASLVLQSPATDN